MPCIKHFIQADDDTTNSSNNSSSGSSSSSSSSSRDGPKIQISSLIESSLRIFHSVCQRAELLDNATTTMTIMKQVESSIHRVAILSCIWSFGVSSADSRSHFDQWFKTHFLSQHSSYFPSFQVKTLFDYSLVRTNETNILLEWMVFDCNSVINTLNSINKGLDDSTSEKRLNRSYQDMYYTSMITTSITTGTMLIPTATAAAYTLIQASLMHAGGKIVLVTGSHGSGKSSITKQLSQLAKTITTSKLSIATASRWLCHIHDCKPMELQNHINKARQILLPKMLERKLFNNYGTIMIDDVNIGVVASSHNSCVELFRKSCERKMMYNVKKEFWSTSFQNYFILMNSKSVYDDSSGDSSSRSSGSSGSSSSSGGRYNDRFIRHTNVLYCDVLELEHVFEKKLQRSCSDLKDDLALDLSKITFQFAAHLSEALHEIVTIVNNDQYNIHSSSSSLSLPSSSSSISSNYNTMILSNADRLFIKFNSKASVTSLVNKILTKVQLSLSTFTAYTSNDVIRVWDRMIAEITLRHPILFEQSNNAHEVANSNYNYSFPSFTNFVDREKLLRIQAVENAISILPTTTNTTSTTNTSTTITTLPLPLSYSKNTYGFFKTGVDVFPGKEMLMMMII